MPRPTIVFDLDGTLVDSAPDLAASVNHVLATIGKGPLPVDTVRSMTGGGARLMLERALTATAGDGDLDRLYPLLIDHYEAHIADLSRTFPGVVDALDALHDRGVALAVVTNKLEHLSVRLLKEIGLIDRFACVIGGDTLGIGKPDPAPILEMIRRCGGRRAALVGDSGYDVKAARAAEIPSALFLPHGGDSLGADVAFRDYVGLVPALDSLNG